MRCLARGAMELKKTLGKPLFWKLCAWVGLKSSVTSEAQNLLAAAGKSFTGVPPKTLRAVKTRA